MITSYAPEYESKYRPLKDISISIGTVTDNRGLELDEYYVNYKGDRGKFDKPVTILIREAVAEELKKAGITTSTGNTKMLILNCDVLNYG